MSEKQTRGQRHWPLVLHRPRTQKWTVKCQFCTYSETFGNKDDANKAYSAHANSYGRK